MTAPRVKVVDCLVSVRKHIAEPAITLTLRICQLLDVLHHEMPSLVHSEAESLGTPAHFATNMDFTWREDTPRQVDLRQEHAHTTHWQIAVPHEQCDKGCGTLVNLKLGGKELSAVWESSVHELGEDVIKIR